MLGLSDPHLVRLHLLTYRFPALLIWKLRLPANHVPLPPRLLAAQGRRDLNLGVVVFFRGRDQGLRALRFHTHNLECRARRDGDQVFDRGARGIVVRR